LAQTDAASGPAQASAAAQPAAPAIRVVAHESLAALRSLEQPWRNLFAQSASAGPFLDFDWICSWAELFAAGPGRLHVLAVHEGADLIGIAPWLLVEPRRWYEPRRLTFLGAEPTACDYLDVLCAPQAERSVAAALHAHLFQSGAAPWQRLELCGVRAGSAFLFHFAECFEQAGKHVEVAAGAYCPRRRLAASAAQEALADPRPARLRYHRQRLERAGALRYEHCGGGEAGFAAALAEFSALYGLRWGAPSAALRFVQAHAGRVPGAPQLCVDLLRVDARAAAGLVHLRRGDALYMYLMAVDRERFHNVSLGNVLLAFALERAAADGVRVYDFLRGSEDYKHRWASEAERCVDLIAYRPGPAALAQLALRSARQWLKAACR
jgi:CelD/BcsL family acetyltransferase involved in cellulose biosynthesis